MDKIQELSRYLKALGDPTRLKMVELLNSGKPLCVNALARRLNITQSAVSQHLRILRQANLVSGNRMGYHIHYEVNNQEALRLESILSEIVTKKV